MDFSGRHGSRDGGGIVGDGGAGFVERDAVDREGAFGLVEGDACVAGSGDDASPVGVVAGDGRFDEGRLGDLAGDAGGFVAGGAAGDVDRDEVLGPFGVADDLLSKVGADVGEAGWSSVRCRREVGDLFRAG